MDVMSDKRKYMEDPTKRKLRQWNQRIAVGLPFPPSSLRSRDIASPHISLESDPHAANKREWSIRARITAFQDGKGRHRVDGRGHKKGIVGKYRTRPLKFHIRISGRLLLKRNPPFTFTPFTASDHSDFAKTVAPLAKERDADFTSIRFKIVE